MASFLEHGLPDLVKTKSIERVVAPIVTHLCHLVLICESGEVAEQFATLEGAAEGVAKASKNMAARASKLAAESDDDIMKTEMDPVVASMKLSGQHMLLAAQKLSIQPHLANHRDELISSTQNVLLGLLKILLVEDDATVRKVVTAAHWLLDCLSQLEGAPDIPSLLGAFRDFSEALLLLNDLAERRAQDLREPRQREHLLCSLDTLKKCVSMLHTAMCTTIKHPQSDQAQAAKKYIVDLVDSTITGLISTLKNSCRGNLLGPTRNYTDKLQVLVRLLSVSERFSIRESNFDSLLGDLVIHCMMVANTSRKCIQPTVVDRCRCILRLWLEISQQAKLSGSSTDPTQQRQKNLEDNCSSLMQQLLKLNDSVVMAILYQVLDVFATATAPFDKLLNIAIRSPDSLQPLLIAFLSHADRMVQVASFISGLSTDLKCIENVESSRVCLIRLKAVAVPLLQELSRGSHPSGSLERLQDVHQRWAEETSQLTDCLNDILDVKALSGLTLQEMEEDYSGCEKAFKTQSRNHFTEHATNLMGHMNHTVRSVKRHVDRSDNPIFRNGLLVLVKQVEASIVEVTACVELLHSEPGWDIESFAGFSHKFSKAIERFHILREGLDGLQHPHLLSPLRDEARHPSFLRPTLVSESSSLDHDAAPEFSALNTEKRSASSPCCVQHVEKDPDKPPLLSNINISESGELEFVSEVKPTHTLQDVDLLPLLYEVLKATKEKDVTSLNVACTRVLELSNSYIQAAKEANAILNDIEGQTLEGLRLEVVALTPILVQAAQETAMGAAMSTDNIYKHATLFSDGISNMRQILLPAAGTWYHAACAMFQGGSQKANTTEQLSEVMQLCSDVVQLVTSSEIVARGEHHESIAMLHSKLKKAQTNAKHLAELASFVPVAPDKLEGPCILWALSVQILLNSLDKILGGIAYGGTEQAIRRLATPQKRMGVISENSLRVQEAARLTSSTCKNGNSVTKMRGLQEEVKVLTEAYLQVTDNLNTVPLSDIHQLAKSELLQRQLLVNMKVLSGLVSRFNKEYTSRVENTIRLAVLASTDNGSLENIKEAKANFERDAESLLANVKAACQNIQDCLNYIRDPRVRANLRSINEHLSFQISDIVCSARQMAETHDLGHMYSLEIQTQYWSAMAHFLVEEIDMVEGVHQATKRQVRLCLQGREADEAQNMPLKLLPNQETTHPPVPFMVSWEENLPTNTKTTAQDTQNPPKPNQELKRGGSGLIASRVAPSFTYTSLFLKRETDKWDAQNNHIIQVTRGMAEKIYHMAQYLRRKGPIQSKEVFVATAKDVVSSCRTVTQFVRVIADHSLNESSREDLCLIVEKILTTTNQLTIISSVNALTPGSKSSDEILVKNAQNLLHIILQGVQAAETSCIKGLRQPQPNSDGAEAAALCFQWRKNLQMHRAQQNSNPDTDDLGLRKTSLFPAMPSLAPPIQIQETLK
ncbi:hypothetical protein SKAU_G00163470 [Synaphobranchus kaupii]|uniref:Vinculin n=1 Tax=Synaphobranchus kaupii TaxID=118154 RepID=A0A9Q1J044_SYNKA|nr:hypothetical protein SKAU_G00163470 [Synaphobranchus kaupii]